MSDRPREIERAFALARAGVPVSEIKKQLKREGYTAGQIEGREIGKQLRELIRTAQAARHAAAKD